MRLATALVVACGIAAALGVPAGVANAEGESSRAEPRAGYLYPAGAQRGAVVQILAGGQNLRGASAAYVSGEGVSATVVRHVRPLSPQQMQELRRRLADAAEFRRTGRRVERARDPDEDPVELPDHPLLRDLDQKSVKELRAISTRFLGAGQKRQMNAQIAETVEIDVTVAPDAAPGDRELRIATAAGLTNPLRFQVGAVPEISEEEAPAGAADPASLLSSPVVVNGQILPGDADRFRVRARRGQHLVVDVAARRLIPYLADAVPGWFQATAALFDARGREVAFCDDFLTGPDPVFVFDVPATGDYVLEIRDALWRGREDFVYRATIGEEPFISRMFPLGGRSGTPVTASLAGWNLPSTRLELDTSPGTGEVRWTNARRGEWPGNRVAYAVDDLPECEEIESEDAQPLALPVIVNGRIGKPGDVDVFSFEGRAGDEIVGEVSARRLGSPMDSVLTVTDAAGRVLVWNDDHDDPASGLVTHQADSYVRLRIAEDGVVRVKLADAQRHGGAEFAYRLRVSAPRPDVRVFVTPSSVNVQAGRAAPVSVHVVRRDGFDGPLEIALLDAPAGFSMSGARLAAGVSSARVTLSARDATGGPYALRLEARAQSGEDEIRRPVVAADDRMQAFAYRHLVPAQEFLVAVRSSGRAAPAVDLAVPGPVQVPAGGAARVRVRVTGRAFLPNLELDAPPPGLTLEDVRAETDGFSFALRSGPTLEVGAAGNVLVEILGPAKTGRGASLGWLPAIAFEILQP